MFLCCYYAEVIYRGEPPVPRRRRWVALTMREAFREAYRDAREYRAQGYAPILISCTTGHSTFCRIVPVLREA